MAGVYIHIPFCRQKCYYCDFYKTVNTSHTNNFIEVLKKEIVLRKKYIGNENVETIYFGGGTPSVLTEKEITEILASLKNNFTIDANVEITFEANPDDLDLEYLNSIKIAGINRLSIGIQAFQNKFLKKMNRRHDATQAINCIENAAKIGFNNVSADLIYGLPDLSKTDWKNSLKQIFLLPVHHLSAYHLTYHKGTAFYTWLKKGTLKEVRETESIWQFNTLIDLAKEHGFEQYEISNFAVNNMYSKHNTSYWTGKNYLGLGPSAHSFNGVSRRWNIADVEGYINAINSDMNFFEEEILTKKDKFNEYILTSIRTKWGISAKEIETKFGVERLKEFYKNIENYKRPELLNEKNGIFTLTREGLFVSDEIMANLMII